MSKVTKFWLLVLLLFILMIGMLSPIIYIIAIASWIWWEIISFLIKGVDDNYTKKMTKNGSIIVY